MEFFKTNTQIPFMRQRKYAAIFSIIIMLASIISLFTNGLNLGLDFTGGTQIDMQFNHSANTDKIRDTMIGLGFKQATVRTAGTSQRVSVRIGQQKISTEAIKDKIHTAIPDAQLGQIQFIGAQVGKTLLTNGILAIIVSLIGTMVYIALRFEFRFSISAALALLHDPILILGIFSFFHLEFNLIVLASVLTVIGYSLNDTIVVYDRVRENFHRVRRKSVEEIMDLSINQTLSRTIMTSGLTLVVVITLFVFGGDTVHNFSLSLIIGIVIGTYSSIYVAGALAVAMGLTREGLVPSKKIVDDTP